MERFSPAGNSRISYKTKQWYRAKGTRNDTMDSANKDLVISRVCSGFWHFRENSNLHRKALSKRKHDIIRQENAYLFYTRLYVSIRDISSIKSNTTAIKTRTTRTKLGL